MAGFRQNPDSSKTVPADLPTSSRQPANEPPRPPVHLTKSEVEARLLADDPAAKRQAIRALQSINEHQKNILQKLLPTVCLSLKLESAKAGKADQDMIGQLLSVLVHAANLRCGMDDATELLGLLLVKGTVAQKHSAALTISRIDENGEEISPFLRPLVFQLEQDECDQTGRMIISKTLAAYASRSTEKAAFVMDRLRRLDPEDVYVARIIAQCRQTMGIREPQVVAGQAERKKAGSGIGFFAYDTIVENGDRPPDTEVAVAPVPQTSVEESVRRLWDPNPMERKDAVDLLIVYISDAAKAREVLELLPSDNANKPNSFVSGIRNRCCVVLANSLGPRSDSDEKKG